MNPNRLRAQNAHLVASGLLFVCLLLGLSNTVQGADFYLSAGESYVYNVNTFSLSRPTQPGDPSDGTLYGFTGGNWMAKVEFFQDTLLDTPMFSDVHSHSGAVGAVAHGVQFGYAPWADFQGLVRVTALSGTFRLDGLRCDEVVNGGYYTTGWIMPVPEPSAIGLLSLGLLCAGSRFRRKLD